MKQTYSVHCDCKKVTLTILDNPKVHGFCHCNDCRDLLQVPFHSVLAFTPENIEISYGSNLCQEFKHPSKNMTRVFCKECGEILYNTNAMGWKIISQLLFIKNNKELPTDFQSTKHFFYKDRIIDISDSLPKIE